MERSIARFVVLLGSMAAVLAGVASAAGVLLRGDLSTTEFTTVRGEVVEVVTDGIYRFNAEGIVAEGIGWDIVTLFVVVPATLVTLALVWRGSARATLVTAGLLAYLTYQSAQYAVYWALGPLFPIYIATLAFAISALGLLLYGLDLDALRVSDSRPFPRGKIVVYNVAVVVILAGLWLPVIVGSWGETVVDQLQGGSTLVVPVFDLGLLVPLAVFTGLSVYLRLPVGYVSAALILVKGASMALAIVSMLLVEALVTDELALPPLVVFAFMAGASVAVGVRALQAIDARPNLRADSLRDRLPLETPRAPEPRGHRAASPLGRAGQFWNAATLDPGRTLWRHQHGAGQTGAQGRDVCRLGGPGAERRPERVLLAGGADVSAAAPRGLLDHG